MNSLTHMFRPMVGREALLEQLTTLSQNTSWVTLIGAPGVGKTRLAKSFVQSSGGEYRWTDLSEVCTLEECIQTLLQTLQTPLHQGHSFRELLLEACAALPNDTLWVLDGMEGLSAAPHMQTLWRELSSLQIRWLATSPQPLGLPGEYRLRVEPLPTQDALTWLTSCVQPYRPGWSHDDQDITQLTRLIERLDGLPRAIELIAPHLEIFEVSSLLELLDERFEWLVGPDPQAPSLWDSIARVWSHTRTRDREVLEHLAVCPGVWSVALLERVLGVSRGEALRTAQRMCRASWWHMCPDPESGLSMFSMYETLRDFVLKRADPDTLARHRHDLCQIAGDLAEQWLNERTHRPEPQPLKLLRTHENLWVWAFEYGVASNPERVVHCYRALTVVLRDRDALTSLAKHSRQVLSLLDDMSPGHVRGLYACGLGQEAMHVSHMSTQSVKFNAMARQEIDPGRAPRAWASAVRAEFMTCVRQGSIRQDLLTLLEHHARQNRDPYIHAAHQMCLAQHLELDMTGHSDALEHYQRSLELLDRHAHPFDTMQVLWGKARLYEYSADMGSALSCFKRIDAIRIRTHARTHDSCARLAMYMAHATLHTGDLEGCEEMLTRAHASANSLSKDTRVLSYIGAIQAQYRIERGELDQASQQLELWEESAIKGESSVELHKARMLLHWVGGDHEAALLAAIACKDALEEGAGPISRYMIASCICLLEALATWRISTLNAPLELPALPPEVIDHEILMLRLKPWLTLCHGWELYMRDHEVTPALHAVFTALCPESCEQADALMPVQAHDVMCRTLTRHLYHLCGKGLRSEDSDIEVLTISSRGLWFEWRGKQADLQRRGPLRQLLLVLARYHEHSRGVALDVYELFELVWQEPIRNSDSATSRVYNNIARLRGLGLADIIMHIDEGYLLSPDIGVQLSSEAAIQQVQ